VICVPPPRGLGAKVILVVVIAVVLIGLGIGATALGWAFPSWSLGLVGLAIVGLGFLVWCLARVGRRLKELHRTYIAKLRRRSVDTLVLEIAKRWKTRGSSPKNEAVRRAVAGHTTATDRPCAHIVCLGKIKVPNAGDYFFEPEIITPTRATGYQLLFVPAAVAVIAFWAMQKLGFIPVRWVSANWFGYIVLMGLAVGGAWLWRSVIRPTYIRMAPGVIQVLEFRYRRKKPLIRSYPTDAGTVVVLHGEARARRSPDLKLTLMRGDQQDTIDLSRMRNSEQVIERMWQALLSTAPTPPLSDEELVG